MGTLDNGTEEGRSRQRRMGIITANSVHMTCMHRYFFLSESVVNVMTRSISAFSIRIHCTANKIPFLLLARRRASFLPAVFCRKMAYSPPDPSTCVLDAFRLSIAERVSAALPPLTVDQVYSGVDYGKKGVDFTIALPRFKLGKVEDVAAKVVAQVGFFSLKGLLISFFLVVPTRRLHRIDHSRQGLLALSMQNYDCYSRCPDTGPRPHARGTVPLLRQQHLGKREKSYNRVFLAQHRKVLPCRPLAKYHHRRFSRKLVQGMRMGGRIYELSRRLGNAGAMHFSFLGC